MNTYYAIVEVTSLPIYTEVLYLNHSCLSTLSFGDEDMAWYTTDYAEAEKMLERVKEKHNTNNFEITEI